MCQKEEKGKDVERSERERRSEKVVEWSTNEMDEKVSSQLVKDTEEMLGWIGEARNIGLEREQEILLAMEVFKF